MKLIIGGVYQGKKEYVLSHYGAEISIYENLENDILKLCDLGKTQDEIINEILKKAVNADVVIAKEPYCSLTPIKKEDRMFTEIYGRLLERLAKKADTVERIICGLVQIIK